jgi:hypothetical protein
VSSRHCKGHHAHEITDAFAEGWDARARALPNERVVNPYRVTVSAQVELHAPGRPVKKNRARERDCELWDQGWASYEKDLADPT